MSASPDLYGEILKIWGAGATIMPLGDVIGQIPGGLAGDNSDRTTSRTKPGASGIDALFTYKPGSLNAFALKLYKQRNLHKTSVVRFNGSTEYLTSPDDTYWSTGDSLNDVAASWGASVLIATGISGAILSKWKESLCKFFELFFIESSPT